MMLINQKFQVGHLHQKVSSYTYSVSKYLVLQFIKKIDISFQLIYFIHIILFNLELDDDISDNAHKPKIPGWSPSPKKPKSKFILIYLLIYFDSVVDDLKFVYFINLIIFFFHAFIYSTSFKN